jgi:hypothetical protein
MSALLSGNLPRIRFTHGNLFCPNARRRVLLDWSDSLLFGAWREVVIALSTCADLCELKTFWPICKELIHARSWSRFVTLFFVQSLRAAARGSIPGAPNATEFSDGLIFQSDRAVSGSLVKPRCLKRWWAPLLFCKRCWREPRLHSLVAT